MTFVSHTDQSELASDNEASDSDENEAQKPAEGKKLPVFGYCTTVCSWCNTQLNIHITGGDNSNTQSRRKRQNLLTEDVVTGT